jgi:hypothetical protein
MMHKNYGYAVFHRIFGEYKMNQVIAFWSPYIAIQAILKGCIDAILIVGILLETSYFFKNDGILVMPESNGMVANQPAYTFYFQMALTIAFCSRLTD